MARSLSAIVAVGALALARAQHHTNFSHLHLCEQHNSQEMLDRHSLTHFCPHEAVLEYSQEQGFDGMAVLLLDPFTQRPVNVRDPRARPHDAALSRPLSLSLALSLSLCLSLLRVSESPRRARAQCDPAVGLQTTGDDTWPVFGDAAISTSDPPTDTSVFSIDDGTRYKYKDWSGNTKGGIANMLGHTPADALIPFATDGKKDEMAYGSSYYDSFYDCGGFGDSNGGYKGGECPTSSGYPELADGSTGAHCPELSVVPVAEQGMKSVSFYFGGNTFFPVLKQVQGNGVIEAMTIIAWVNSSFCVRDADDQTGEEYDNQAIFDLDRSDYFSFFLTPSGLVKFSSNHKNMNLVMDSEETADTSLTCPSPTSKQQFHMLAITFSCTMCGEDPEPVNYTVDGVKRIYRDGALTLHDEGEYDALTDTYSFYPAIGMKQYRARYPIIGDGGEGSNANTGAPCERPTKECDPDAIQKKTEQDFWKFYRNKDYFLGQIGLLGWWDYAMSEAQIQAVYDRTKKYYQACEAGDYCINGIAYPCDASYYCPGTWEVRRPPRLCPSLRARAP